MDIKEDMAIVAADVADKTILILHTDTDMDADVVAKVVMDTVLQLY